MNSQGSNVQKVTAKVRSIRNRKAKSPKSRLEKRLFAYALAAGAGATLTSAAQAKIVYTSVFRVTTNGLPGRYNIDLDNDGIPDFLVSSYQLSGVGRISVVPNVTGDKIVGARFRGGFGGSAWAAPLVSGASIGPGAKFFAGANRIGSSSSCNQLGPPLPLTATIPLKLAIVT
jgi:hypothetical protein